MKLNNKGFAISTIMYMILVVAVILLTLSLSLLSSRKLIIDKIKKETMENVYLDNGNSDIPEPKSFKEDSWDTIVENVRVGNTYGYHVGDEKEIELYGLGTFKVRIANLSNGEGCGTEGFSETACGFVVEFVDIITLHTMNPSTTEYEYGTNKGGWKESDMRAYLHDVVFKLLPQKLQDSIISTKVISGRGSGDSSNIETIDKLYLLSPREVWIEDTSNQVSIFDAAYNSTRQLDYYATYNGGVGVNTYSYSGAIKKYNGTTTRWWLRSAHSGIDSAFYNAEPDGIWDYHSVSTSTFGVSPAFRLATTSKSVSEPKSFKEDSWDTIVENVKKGNVSKYNVGDEKEITLDGLGTFKVRIANTSNNIEDGCGTDDFSETACGFVIEFVDIISQHNMNETDTNVGGWKDSDMRLYLNNEIFKSLPKALQYSILDTRVISGHGSTESENFVTEDKLYLLSTHEVWIDSTSNEVSTYDTAYDSTRQLDYYSEQGVTTSSRLGAVKGNGTSWWLRSATTSSSNHFYDVIYDGDWATDIANSDNGVSPAFRLEMNTPTQKYQPKYYIFEDMQPGVGAELPGGLSSTFPPKYGSVEVNVYIGYGSNDDKAISDVYACFMRNGEQFCLNTDSSGYGTNVKVLKYAFRDKIDNCTFSSNESNCEDNSLTVDLNPDYVGLDSSVDGFGFYCSVTSSEPYCNTY